MGRHSAPRSSRAKKGQPVIAAGVVVLAIWGGDGAVKPSTQALAGSILNSAPTVAVDLSAQATGSQTNSLSDGTSRVSRDTRRPASTAAKLASRSATGLPARRALPRVDRNKTVLGTWVRPSSGVMSTCFCVRWGVFHNGVDLAASLGSPIVAAGDGVVLEAGPTAGFGHWILIQHSNGDVSLYGHMYSVLVTAGQHVRAGQHIADVGADGESTGPHLHFGVMHSAKGGPYLDPAPWLKARGVDVGVYHPNA